MMEGLIGTFVMPASQFDNQETTLVWDHSAGTVELYTTSRRLWLRAIARSGHFISATDLNPGYQIIWKASDIKQPELIIKPHPSGPAALEAHLTDDERQSRANAATRLLAARRSSAASQE